MDGKHVPNGTKHVPKRDEMVLTGTQLRAELELFMQETVGPTLLTLGDQISQKICAELPRKNSEVKRPSSPLASPSVHKTDLIHAFGRHFVKGNTHEVDKVLKRKAVHHNDYDNNSDEKKTTETKMSSISTKDASLTNADRIGIPLRDDIEQMDHRQDPEESQGQDLLSLVDGNRHEPTFSESLEQVFTLPESILGEITVMSQPLSSTTNTLLFETQETTRLLGNAEFSITPAPAPIFKENLTEPGQPGFRGWARSVVTSSKFDLLFATMIFLNVIVIGVETEMQALFSKGALDTTDWQFVFLHLIDMGFCFVFTVEILLRLIAFGTQFFRGRKVLWNMFDMAVCICQILEMLAQSLAIVRMPIDTSIFRILRMLRLLRISRMVRLLETFRTIMASIVSSLVSLAGTMWLLLLFLYAVSVFITQIVIDAGEPANVEGMQYWFGDLARTYFTMFESIFGGVSWDEPAAILMSDISPWLGVFYGASVGFSTLVMLNMATGVFINEAMKRAQQDNDTNTAIHITELFLKNEGLDKSVHDITYDEFCNKINAPDMQEYFNEINVDPSQVMGLYKLLDVDGSGSVDADELINGLLRLRGNAKALELQILSQETTRMFQSISEFQHQVEGALARICTALEVGLTHGATALQASVT